jgi:hypothetical protein
LLYYGLEQRIARQSRDRSVEAVPSPVWKAIAEFGRSARIASANGWEVERMSSRGAPVWSHTAGPR